jgi:RNA polymerase sigma-70 factor (ECF subfamily)
MGDWVGLMSDDEAPRGDKTEALGGLLASVNAGEPGATDRLAAAIHEELRAMARRRLAKDFGPRMGGVTIQPTVLANDTLMRLIRQRGKFDNAGHFFAIASRMMMRVLLDYHRERKAAKRGGRQLQVTLDPERNDVPDTGTGLGSGAASGDIEALNEALEKLAQLDPRKADVVRYRILWGLTTNDIGDALGVSPATVERDWAFAKAWLSKELAKERDGGGDGEKEEE